MDELSTASAPHADRLISDEETRPCVTRFAARSPSPALPPSPSARPRPMPSSRSLMSTLPNKRGTARRTEKSLLITRPAPGRAEGARRPRRPPASAATRERRLPRRRGARRRTLATQDTLERKAELRPSFVAPSAPATVVLDGTVDDETTREALITPHVTRLRRPPRVSSVPIRASCAFVKSIRWPARYTAGSRLNATSQEEAHRSRPWQRRSRR